MASMQALRKEGGTVSKDSQIKANWLGYAITGKEIIAMDDLSRLGIDHWRGIRIEFERRGKVRTAEPFEYSALPNYIWIRPEPYQVSLLSEVRFLGHTFRPLLPQVVEQFAAYRCQVEAKEAEARALIAEREEILAQARAEKQAIVAQVMKRAEAMKVKEASAAKRMTEYRTAIVAYQDGARIEIREGPLAGELATFRRMVQGAADLFPSIEAEMEMMGRVVPVLLDPLAVRKAV